MNGSAQSHAFSHRVFLLQQQQQDDQRQEDHYDNELYYGSSRVPPRTQSFQDDSQRRTHTNKTPAYKLSSSPPPAQAFSSMRRGIYTGAAAEGRGAPTTSTCMRRMQISEPGAAAAPSRPTRGQSYANYNSEVVEDDNPAQQQAVLESLASYLEGELMSRLQSYSELLIEVESLRRERSFYYTKLLHIEKVCKHVMPLKASIAKVDPILSILSASMDMPCAWIDDNARQ